MTADPSPGWRPDGHASGYRSERAEIGIHKLVVTDVAADGAWPEEIRWEVLGAGQASLASGGAETFEEAKQLAENARRNLAVS